MKNTEIAMEESGVQLYAGRYWGETMKIKTAMGQMLFLAFAQVTVAVFSLSRSNVDCDRAFSVVQKVHTECRQSLNANMFTALLQCKLKNDRSCFEYSVQWSLISAGNLFHKVGAAKHTIII